MVVGALDKYSGSRAGNTGNIRGVRRGTSERRDVFDVAEGTEVIEGFGSSFKFTDSDGVKRHVLTAQVVQRVDELAVFDVL